MVIEAYEFYFGTKRQRGYHGKLKSVRGTLKQSVSGIFERQDRVYSEIVFNCKNKDLARHYSR